MSPETHKKSDGQRLEGGTPPTGLPSEPLREKEFRTVTDEGTALDAVLGFTDPIRSLGN